MGKIRSGILGPVSGRIGGVVGANWKGVSYLRSYVVPSPSATDLQLAQRTRFAYTVAAAKPFVGRVFNTYYDKFLGKESGFNRFIKENIPDGVAPPVLSTLVCSGPLYPGSFTSFDENGGTPGTYDFVISSDLGVDGSATDILISWIRNPATNAVLFGVDGTRDDGGVSIVGGAPWIAIENVEGGYFFAKLNGSLVVKISTSQSLTTNEL
jgi:hypothetical protein